MGFIIMQPHNDTVSLDALELLRITGENNFDKTMNGPRLRLILFGSWKCTATESHYHSFVGEQPADGPFLRAVHNSGVRTCIGFAT